MSVVKFFHRLVKMGGQVHMVSELLLDFDNIHVLKLGNIILECVNITNISRVVPSLHHIRNFCEFFAEVGFQISEMSVPNFFEHLVFVGQE